MLNWLEENNTQMNITSPSVIEVLARRHVKDFLSIENTDKYKVGLIVEGGAMKSIISAGMLLALRDLKMLKLFDVFIGSSGGSLNLAYLLSGQGDKGLSIFYEHMIQEKAINIYHAIPDGEHIVRMKSIESILLNLVKIDHLALKKKYQKKLFVGVTNLDKLTGELVEYDLAALHTNTNFTDYLLAGALQISRGIERGTGSGKSRRRASRLEIALRPRSTLACKRFLSRLGFASGSVSDALCGGLYIFSRRFGRRFRTTEQFCRKGGAGDARRRCFRRRGNRTGIVKLFLTRNQLPRSDRTGSAKFNQPDAR